MCKEEKTIGCMAPAKLYVIDGVNMQWEDVPGKGRCLVPKGAVSTEDVINCRRFKNKRGQVMFIMSIYGPQNSLRFYTVGPQSEDGGCRGNYSSCSYALAGDLARHINEAGPGSDLHFNYWI